MPVEEALERRAGKRQDLARHERPDVRSPRSTLEQSGLADELAGHHIAENELIPTRSGVARAELP